MNIKNRISNIILPLCKMVDSGIINPVIIKASLLNIISKFKMIALEFKKNNKDIGKINEYLTIIYRELYTNITIKLICPQINFNLSNLMLEVI